MIGDSPPGPPALAVAAELRALKRRGILVQMALDGQLLEVVGDTR